MRRALAFLLLVFALGACCSPAGKAPVAPGPMTGGVEALTSKTVALVAVDEDSGETRAYCTGVWVGPKAILTAAHCVVDEYRYVVREDVFVGGGTVEVKYPTTHSASALGKDEEHDLALLAADGQTPPHGIAELGANPQQGAHVQVMGHSKGFWWSYSSGDVAAIRLAPLGTDPMLWIQTTAPISPGNSGGGLFDEQGRLIGICSRSLAVPRAQNINFFVHTDYLRVLLERLK